jgi:hypothetical protein
MDRVEDDKKKKAREASILNRKVGAVSESTELYKQSLAFFPSLHQEQQPQN